MYNFHNLNIIKKVIMHPKYIHFTHFKRTKIYKIYIKILFSVCNLYNACQFKNYLQPLPL